MASAIRRQWRALGERFTPALRQGFFTTIAIGLYLVLMSALLVVPLRGVVVISTTPLLGRTVADGSVVLTSVGNAALALLAAATFGISVATGALCAAFFQRRYVDDGVLIAIAVLFPLPLLAMLRALSEAAAQFAATAAGSSTILAAFVGFWALMLAYTIKPFWDEAKKRLEPWMTRRAVALDRLLGA